MKRYVRTWCLVGAWIVSATVGMESSAQDKVKEKKPNAPLPDYVGQVLTADQEKEARKIAESYEAELDKLRAEIRKLNADVQKIQKQRDGEIEALLTNEQKARIKELIAQAKAKSEANRKAKESARAKPVPTTKEPAKEAAKE